jgi:hypothetical protein
MVASIALESDATHLVRRMHVEVGGVEPSGSHSLLTLAHGGQWLEVATRTDFQGKPRRQVVARSSSPAREARPRIRASR